MRGCGGSVWGRRGEGVGISDPLKPLYVLLVQKAEKIPLGA